MPANLSIRRFVDQFSSLSNSLGKNGYMYTIPLLGLDSAGKTTLLHRLKTGELVTTVPTVGVFLEVADVRFQGTRPLIKMPSWDAGGNWKRLPPAFLAHYTQAYQSDALIWAVDSSDRECIPDSVEEFGQALRRLSASNPHRSNIPVLILATKQDLPNAMRTDEIREMFIPVPPGISIFVVGTTFNQSLTEGALPEAFRWLIDSIENAKAGRTPPLSPTDDPRSTTALEIELDSWLERAEIGSSAARLLHQFETFSLLEWDHYTRIRIIFSLLTAFGRIKGRDMILEGMEKYAARSTHEKHVTMTYFWIQVVHFGIRSMPLAPESDGDSVSVSYLESMLDDETETIFDTDSIISEAPSEWSLLDDEAEVDIADEGSAVVQANEVAEQDEYNENGDAAFIKFLLCNPFLADDDLWTEYYSREVMMSSKAKARMVLPDKQRLPNLVGREEILSSFKGKRLL
ncbi:ADP-ribosylation factor family-domain-containing protein [Mycena metata]|uniref:ADP-ribosylation factor family-domain-containing protein n=1 Tax=Mycena metata TaxID=1033252 RepID=A0AAD7HWK1_9AGAR|nr:ADP-ribosylation factor family-domain-containing protein [Mycena metata]